MIEIEKAEIVSPKRYQKKNPTEIPKKRGATKKEASKRLQKRKDLAPEVLVDEDQGRGIENRGGNQEKENDPDQEEVENGHLLRELREREVDPEVKIVRGIKKVAKKKRKRILKLEIEDPGPHLGDHAHVPEDHQGLFQKYQGIMMRRKKVLIQKKILSQKNRKQLIKDLLKNLIIWIYQIHHKFWVVVYVLYGVCFLKVAVQ